MYGGKESGLKFIVTLREPASRAISSWEFKNEFNPKKGREWCALPAVVSCRDFIFFYFLFYCIFIFFCSVELCNFDFSFTFFQQREKV